MALFDSLAKHPARGVYGPIYMEITTVTEEISLDMHKHGKWAADKDITAQDLAHMQARKSKPITIYTMLNAYKGEDKVIEDINGVRYYAIWSRGKHRIFTWEQFKEWAKAHDYRAQEYVQSMRILTLSFAVSVED